MRCIIIGNGSYDNFFDIKPDDFVICADGGYNYAVKFNITPDCIIGDMDSVKTDISGKETMVYPREKDYTDGELAVRLAIEKGFGVVYCSAQSIFAQLQRGVQIVQTVAEVEHSVGGLAIQKPTQVAQAAMDVGDDENFTHRKLLLKKASPLGEAVCEAD